MLQLNHAVTTLLTTCSEGCCRTLFKPVDINREYVFTRVYNYSQLCKLMYSTFTAKLGLYSSTVESSKMPTKSCYILQYITFGNS